MLSILFHANGGRQKNVQSISVRSFVRSAGSRGWRGIKSDTFVENEFNTQKRERNETGKKTSSHCVR